MKTTKTIFLIGCVAVAGVVLSACRENEQGRVLRYDKGRYAGAPDTEISADARRRVQDRVHHQSGLDSISGGTPSISGASSSADVRPPGTAVRPAN